MYTVYKVFSGLCDSLTAQFTLYTIYYFNQRYKSESFDSPFEINDTIFSLLSFHFKNKSVSIVSCKFLVILLTNFVSYSEGGQAMH